MPYLFTYNIKIIPDLFIDELSKERFKFKHFSNESLYIIKSPNFVHPSISLGDSRTQALPFIHMFMIGLLIRMDSLISMQVQTCL